MTQFTIHTLETAPAASKPALEKLKAAVGMIPNLAGAMSESPQLIEAFATLRGLLQASGSFSPAEREIISLVNAVENGCRYCTLHQVQGQRRLNVDPKKLMRMKKDDSALTPRERQRWSSRAS